VAESRVPAVLLQRVARDLRPVSPLASPWRRMLGLIPLGALMLIGVPLVWGFRANLAPLTSSAWGVAVAWGLSGVQTLAGLLVVGAALRESVPGRTLPAARVTATLGFGCAVVLGVTWLTDLVMPSVSPPGTWTRFVWECAAIALLSGLPGLFVVAWAVSRALPPRPAVAGAIYGLGAGILADSGVRLFCWVSEPSHVLAAHGGAILALMVAGAILSVIVERIRPPA
jgi:hypothetical protein